MREMLETYLHSTLSRRADLCIEGFHRINQGNSNTMVGLTLRWREGCSILSREYILKMPPEKSIMEPYNPVREYGLMRDLRGTAVTVPDLLLLEEDESILGRPFLIMEKVEGDTLAFAYHALSPGKKKRLSAEYARTLAEIHAADWRRLGPAGWEVPEDASQFATEELRRCKARLEGIGGIPRKILEDALAQLSANIPRGGRLALVHGDYNIANVLFRGEKIVAVLDWEMACIGDPALDLGWLYPGNAMALGLPLDIEDFAALYQKASGGETENLPFYQSLAMVKLAIGCIRAALLLEQNNRGKLHLFQMGFGIPYILNSICYLVAVGLKALQPKK